MVRQELQFESNGKEKFASLILTLITRYTSVDLVKMKLYFIKPITVAENQPIMTIYIEPMKYEAKQR